MSTNAKVWRNVGLPEELHAEIGAIALAEDRTRYAVIKRAIEMYRQQQSETAVALK